jgi:hypothetical protein
LAVASGIQLSPLRLSRVVAHLHLPLKGKRLIARDGDAPVRMVWGAGR